jgi:hypothetical protein
MAGMVHIPWYATGFRGDKVESALADVTATAMRYGALSYAVHRNRDDRYKFLQMVEFDSKLDFERWWSSQEMIDFRVIASSWFQVPVLYSWNDVITEGRLTAGEDDGNGGAESPAPEPAPETPASA